MKLSLHNLLSGIPGVAALPKWRVQPRKLKYLTLGCGGLGLALRGLLYATGVDDKGLLASGHFAWVLLWILSAVAAGVLLLCLRPLRGPAGYRESFPVSVFSALGCGLGAVSAGLTAFAEWGEGFVLYALVAFLAVAAFAVIALCRATGRKPHFLLHVVICVHFALRMLDLYQTWSFAPQIQDYCFQLFACIALTMMAYQLAAFDMGKGDHRKLWTAGLAAVYLCCLSLGSSDSLFFLAGGCWAFANLSSLRRRRRRQRRQVTVEQTADRTSAE